MRSSVRGSRGRLLSRACLCIWACLILLGSLRPPSSVPTALSLFRGADLVAHGIAYGVLCVLIIWATGGRRLVVPAVAALLLGTFMEFVQPLTGRTFALADIAADAVGIAVGLLTVTVAGRLSRAA